MHFVTKMIQKMLGNQSVDEIAAEFTSVIQKFEGRAEVLKDKILEQETKIKEAIEVRTKHSQELSRAHAYIERFEKLFHL